VTPRLRSQRCRTAIWVMPASTRVLSDRRGLRQHRRDPTTPLTERPLTTRGTRRTAARQRQPAKRRSSDRHRHRNLNTTAPGAIRHAARCPGGGAPGAGPEDPASDGRAPHLTSRAASPSQPLRDGERRHARLVGRRVTHPLAVTGDPLVVEQTLQRVQGGVEGRLRRPIHPLAVLPAVLAATADRPSRIL
jgi:hypothetical protein